MEKISGILPASPRITSVDMKKSGTARSGMPSFGRPQLDVTGSARRMTSTNLENSVRKNPHVEIVDQMAKKFFVERLERPVDNTVDFESDPALKQLALDSDMDPNTKSELVAPSVHTEEAALEDPMDAPEMGAYLDVQA